MIMPRRQLTAVYPLFPCVKYFYKVTSMENRALPPNPTNALVRLTTRDPEDPNVLSSRFPVNGGEQQLFSKPLYKIHEDNNQTFKGVNWTQYIQDPAATAYVNQTLTNFTFQPGDVVDM
jgi:hypothetical protein